MHVFLQQYPVEVILMILLMKRLNAMISPQTWFFNIHQSSPSHINEFKKWGGGTHEYILPTCLFPRLATASRAFILKLQFVASHFLQWRACRRTATMIERETKYLLHILYKIGRSSPLSHRNFDSYLLL